MASCVTDSRPSRRPVVLCRLVWRKPGMWEGGEFELRNKTYFFDKWKRALLLRSVHIDLILSGYKRGQGLLTNSLLALY